MDARRHSYYFFAILCFIGLYIAFGFLFALDKRVTSNIPYEIFRGKVHAMKQASGPRILLLGGSNTIWGMRSQIIEDSTGVPTFNLALSSEAHDPKAMRTLALSVVQAQDTVIYASISFWNSSNVDRGAAAEILRAAGLATAETSRLEAMKQTLDRIWSPYPQKTTIITSLPALYRRYVLHEPSVHMQDLNPKGDLARCHTAGAGAPNTYVPPADQSVVLQELEEFEEELQRRGASLVLLFPPALVVLEQRNQWIQGFTPQFEAMKKRFTVIQNSLEESLYTDKDYFCDTGFHLADAEAAARSQRVGNFMRQIQKLSRRMTDN